MIETSVLEERVEQNNRLQAAESKAIFGFWVYLMTDCVLFASLFAVYAVLHNNTFGGESGSQLFSLPYVLTETMILLTSSFTSGLGSIAAHRGDVRRVMAWFSLTFLLGASFLAMELNWMQVATVGDEVVSCPHTLHWLERMDCTLRWDSFGWRYSLSLSLAEGLNQGSSVSLLCSARFGIFLT
jgi:heme/copper-type cytochrome/quinol oxidase subunit 3